MYGSRNVAPDIEAAEFWTAAAKLVRPRKELEGFRTRARTVAEACGKTRREEGSGRACRDHRGKRLDVASKIYRLVPWDKAAMTH